MFENEFSTIQLQLTERRIKLKKVLETSGQIPNLVDLLKEVDAALERIDSGTYGKCIICHDSIEKDRLFADPLITFCLDHLDYNQQKSLEQDLELASQIQNTLLPVNNLMKSGVEISYYYLPAGPVSGDYCDLVVSKDGEESLYFILGDITGKGIAASMLVSHMHAMFHSLIDLQLPLDELVNRINRLFCESSLYTHFVTMVCGKIYKNGRLEICNAGHCYPILIRKTEIIDIYSTGLPIGLFHSSRYSVANYQLATGDSLFLYSDGLSEARRGDEEFGVERINHIASLSFKLSSSEIISKFLENLNHFLGNSSKNDDLTIMAITKTE